jgi:hypothetical protein
MCHPSSIFAPITPPVGRSTPKISKRVVKLPRWAKRGNSWSDHVGKREAQCNLQKTKSAPDARLLTRPGPMDLAMSGDLRSRQVERSPKGATYREGRVLVPAVGRSRLSVAGGAGETDGPLGAVR